MGDPFKGLLLLLVYYISTAEGEIRCYCTESGCVTTGYMCKSQLGMCYSLVKYMDDSMNPTPSSVVHGCADTLNREPRISTCAGQGLRSSEIEGEEKTVNTTLSSDTVEIEETVVIEEKVGDESNRANPSEPRLTCCTQDMCNYRDITILIETQPNDKGLEGVSSERTQDVERPQKDVWFKAAVIAVPIAGGFILILLVLLAVRMLRTDSRNHRRLIQIRRERSLTKAQLYVTDHFVDNKEQKSSPCDSQNNQIYNPSAKRDHSHNHNHHHNSHHSHNSHNNHNHTHSHNSHRNSNSHHHKHIHPKVTTNRDGYTYEQIVSPNTDLNFANCELVPTQCSAPPSSYPSVIVWGKPKQTDPGDVV